MTVERAVNYPGNREFDFPLILIDEMDSFLLQLCDKTAYKLSIIEILYYFAGANHECLSDVLSLKSTVTTPFHVAQVSADNKVS